MKYIQKKGEDYPVPFDFVIYDASVYEVFEILENEPAAEPTKPKARKPKAAPAVEREPEPEAPVFDPDDFADLD